MNDASTPVSSPSSLKERLNRQVLNVICLCGAFYDTPIEPERHAKRLQWLDSHEFAVWHLSPIERHIGLQSDRSPSLEQRLELTKRYFNLQEFRQTEPPHAELPNLSLQDSMSLLERYGNFKTNYKSWPDDGFEIYALIFASQVFGCLRRELPVMMGLGNVSDILSVIISFYRDEDTRSRGFRDPRLVEAYGLLFSLNFRPENENKPLSAVPDLDFIQKRGVDALLARLKGDLRIIVETTNAETYRHTLREYRQFKSAFRLFHFPSQLRALDIVHDIQQYPTVRTDLEDWPEDTLDDAVFLYIVKCLATLGFWASTEDILENPASNLTIIYRMLSNQSVIRDTAHLPESPQLSTCGDDIEATVLFQRSDAEVSAEETCRQADELISEFVSNTRQYRTR